ncbi:LPXTG cell wall anchor domain-containing protein [Halobacillus locisalis]|uniref:LPXTG cell wall anchor domain-containing protein n=1 Tax=Halobacillus locisalis TaxID=220753 RepID=A0A838CSR5_9BACI|nr:LPXTG cell wall anchor domain-containing protein [Halobacillus locisalis]MBA2174903.1 LPXTG cell wall anchor domain-containing protein [Halobacillus locisalis]
MNKMIYTTFAFILITFLFVPAAHATNSSVEITFSANQHLLKFENIKPGDTLTKHYDIKNIRDDDLTYHLSAERHNITEYTIERQDGNIVNTLENQKAFYNQLELLVMVDSEELYSGKISGFHGLTAERPLSIDQQEQLTIKVSFPPESGNEFQGLSTALQLNFVAETSNSTTVTTVDTESLDQKPILSSVFGSSLPQTGEAPPTLYYLIGGFLLMTGLGFYTTTVMRKRRE